MNSLAKIYQRPLDLVDSFLDGLTSYRLVLYFLLVLLAWAELLTFDKKLPYSWHAIVFSAGLLVVVCRAFGELFARVLNIARNFESDYITALILSLIMVPAADSKGFLVLAGAGFAAIASKYLVTIGRQHIFNPAAAGAFVSGVLFHHYAGWWVGTAALAPLLIVGGLLIIRKMKRFLMVLIFLAVALAILLLNGSSLAWPHLLWLGISSTPLLFLGFVMLTEPLTSPDSFIKYLPYSLLVGILYSINKFSISPEEALLLGNVLAYALVRGKRLDLRLAKTIVEAEGIHTYVFDYHGTFDFQPGQYLEWTLPLAHSDSRGNRRYLTLSSSPTEHQLAFSVRMPARDASHFKRALAEFKPGDRILAAHLAGSFTLPKDEDKKLAFIAGGIGVTPFRSMIKYLIDKKQDRSVTLLYGASKAEEVAFSDLFAQGKHLGIKVEYVETAKRHVNSEDIAVAVPDYRERLFYLSGPYGFVAGCREALLDMGVSFKDIRSDYFPGYK